MRLTHLGHACLLIEAADRRVLVDPGSFSTGFAELRDLDAIVVTHNHADHFDPGPAAALIRANPGAEVYTDPLTAQKAARAGPGCRAHRRG